MMDVEIAKIAGLQILDRSIDRIRDDIKEIPEEIQIQDREIKKSSDQFAEAENELSDILDEQKKCEQDKEAAKQKLAEYKTKLMTLKTNEEYRAMLNQIDFIEQSTDDFDSKTLELMYFEDEVRGKLGNAEKKHQKIVDRAEKRKHILTQQAEELKKKLEKLEAERVEVTSGINIRMIRKYEQIRKAGGGFAVVGLTRGSCGGCMTVIPPQSAVEIRSGKTFNCPFCGRFIIWTDESTFAEKSRK